MVFLKSPSLRLDESVHTKFFSTVFFHKIYSSHLKKKKKTKTFIILVTVVC